MSLVRYNLCTATLLCNNLVAINLKDQFHISKNMIKKYCYVNINFLVRNCLP